MHLKTVNKTQMGNNQGMTTKPVSLPLLQQVKNEVLYPTFMELRKVESVLISDIISEIGETSFKLQIALLFNDVSGFFDYTLREGHFEVINDIFLKENPGIKVAELKIIIEGIKRQRWCKIYGSSFWAYLSESINLALAELWEARQTVEEYNKWVDARENFRGSNNLSDEILKKYKLGKYDDGKKYLRKE